MTLNTILYLHKREGLIDFCNDNQVVSAFCFLVGQNNANTMSGKYDFSGITVNDPKTVEEAGKLFMSNKYELPDNTIAEVKTNSYELASIYAWGFFVQSLRLKSELLGYLHEKEENVSEATIKKINEVADYFMNELDKLE